MQFAGERGAQVGRYKQLFYIDDDETKNGCSMQGFTKVWKSHECDISLRAYMNKRYALS